MMVRIDFFFLNVLIWLQKKNLATLCSLSHPHISLDMLLGSEIPKSGTTALWGHGSDFLPYWVEPGEEAGE